MEQLLLGCLKKAQKQAELHSGLIDVPYVNGTDNDNSCSSKTIQPGKEDL